MQFKYPRSTLIRFISCAFMLPGAAFADQLLMNNGDIISGDIIKIVDGKVHIDPAYGDEYAVNLADVGSIEADQVFAVELMDGRVLDAKFAGPADDGQALLVEDDVTSVGVVDLAAATDPTIEVIVDPWAGTGEFGFVNTTGNTETVALNMRLSFVRTGETWRHRFTGTALNTSENGIKDNERYTIEVQSDRAINDKSWLFGAFRWDADKFGSYDPSISLTAGYGRELMKSDRHLLKAEVGAGYRKLEETLTGFTSNEAIARFLVDDWWQVFESTAWNNRLLIETGSSNTFTQFNTGLVVSMTDRFSVKLGFEVRNNSKVPPGDSEKTDTITSANIVYDF